MEHEREAWAGALGERPSDQAIELFVRIPIQPSTRGGSGTFLAEGSDGRKWWVKPPNHLQGGRVVVSEFVVAGAGALIEAPTCEVQAIAIPEEIVGWEFRPGSTLVAGIGSASLAIDDVVEVNVLDSVERDENQSRIAATLALYDWCWGGDDQWLYCQSDDERIYSHDHGWYLPESGNSWDEASLMARLHEPHEMAAPPGLSPAGLGEMAGRLDTVARSELVQFLSRVPGSWPATDSDLEGLGFFLLTRASEVADRLRRAAGGLP